jgi:hypothetical protein
MLQLERCRASPFDGCRAMRTEALLGVREFHRVDAVKSDCDGRLDELGWVHEFMIASFEGAFCHSPHHPCGRVCAKELAWRDQSMFGIWGFTPGTGIGQ